jgi:hypothetical protein
LWGIFRVLPSDQAVPGLLPLPRIVAAARADAAAAHAGAASSRDRRAPVISRVRLRPRTLTHRARSARLSFRLSERARVRVVLQRRCTKRCARRSRSIARSIRARRGINRIRVPRALHRRRLARGRYVLTLRAVDAGGNRSRARRVRLRVRR